jgi:hypothetical protein
MSIQLKQIGVLWKRQGGKEKYLSGKLDLGLLGEHHIKIFENSKKDDDESQPDYRIVFER